MNEVELKIVGTVVTVGIDKVKPNKWNPNKMSPRKMASLKKGLQEEGWLIGYALIVWGVDDQGKKRNVIIDGEHRWKAAKELGFKDCPVTFVNGITENAAKRLTIKLDQRRGEFDKDMLKVLIADIIGEDTHDTVALDLGFETPDIDIMLGGINKAAEDAVAAATKLPDLPPPPPPPPPPPQKIDGLKGVQPNTRIPVVFYLDSEEEAQYIRTNFAHPTRTYELNGPMLKKVTEFMLSKAPAEFGSMKG